MFTVSTSFLLSVCLFLLVVPCWFQNKAIHHLPSFKQHVNIIIFIFTCYSLSLLGWLLSMGRPGRKRKRICLQSQRFRITITSLVNSLPLEAWLTWGLVLDTVQEPRWWDTHLYEHVLVNIGVGVFKTYEFVHNHKILFSDCFYVLCVNHEVTLIC